MRELSRLFELLTSKIPRQEVESKVTELLSGLAENDRLWACFFALGRRLKGLPKGEQLKKWACERAAVPPWLLVESIAAVGDLAETLSQIIPRGRALLEATVPPVAQLPSLSEWCTEALTYVGASNDQGLRHRQERWVKGLWERLGARDRTTMNRILLGGFKASGAHEVLARALAQITQLPLAEVAFRLSSPWTPDTAKFRDLFAAADPTQYFSPTGFHEVRRAAAGELPDGIPEEWLVDRLRGGTRAQLLCMERGVALWGSAEQLLNSQYPEICGAAQRLSAGSVLEGEIVEVDGEGPCFVAFDLVRLEGVDQGTIPLHERLTSLERCVRQVESAQIRRSATHGVGSWDALVRLRAEGRGQGIAALLLRQRESRYQVAPPGGSTAECPTGPASVASQCNQRWLVLYPELLRIRAVLMYAARGRGAAAKSFSELTLGVWRQGELLPVAKAHVGGAATELERISQFVRENSIERFGPVRRVQPELVFEIAFEGLRRSVRHKSGVILKGAHVVGLRRDLTPDAADSVEAFERVLAEGSVV